MGIGSHRQQLRATWKPVGMTPRAEQCWPREMCAALLLPSQGQAPLHTGNQALQHSK